MILRRDEKMEILVEILEKLSKVQGIVKDGEKKELQDIFTGIENIYIALLKRDEKESEIEDEENQVFVKFSEQYGISLDDIRKKCEKKRNGLGIVEIRRIFENIYETSKKGEMKLRSTIDTLDIEVQSLEKEFSDAIQEDELIDIQEKIRSVENKIIKLEMDLKKLTEFMDRIQDYLVHSWKLEKFAFFTRGEIEKIIFGKDV